MKKAVLIGLGMVAETHLNAVRDAKGVTLAGVMGRDSGKAAAFADKAAKTLRHDVEVFTSIDAVAANSDVDFVILVTPPDARVEIVEKLVAAGKPILMEKPVERTLAAAQGIVALCDRHAVPLGITFQHRARAASMALKNALDARKLGDIVSAEIRVPWWRDQDYYDIPGRGTYARDGGGVMINQAIHTLDLALWLLGPFHSVQSLMHTTQMHRMEAEDWAGALFTTHNGAVGSLVATTAACPGSTETIHLHGTHASAHLESGVMTLTSHSGETEVVGENTATGAGADPMAFTHAWHQSILENFLAHLDDQTPLIASGHSALHAHAVIDAMERSNTSQKRVEVTKP